MNGRRICVATGTRAEFGLLSGLMREIRADRDLVLQVIATGTHLSPEFGLTVREIEDEGFLVDERVEMLLSSDSPVGVAKSIGLGTIGFADALSRLQPDLLVVLGDRFEILACAQAALVAKIPIAHIHGGEASHGAIDDQIRHAVTKMAHLHFVAAEPYGRRVIQMGENPASVFVTGAPGLDHLSTAGLLQRSEFEDSIDFKLDSPTLLVTYHPATLDTRKPEEPLAELLSALDGHPECKIIFTKANADAGGRIINELIDAYAASRPERTRVFTSLGRRRYLSALHLVGAVVGNSSSGIIEAPAIPVASVNIGDRQAGRLKARSVIDCPEDRRLIHSAIATALSPTFRDLLSSNDSLYGRGGSAPLIKRLLKEVDLTDILVKGFFDLAFDDPE